MVEDVSSRTAWALTDALRSLIPNGGSEATDSIATVTDVDSNGTIWVCLPGSVERTIVNGTSLSRVSAGDIVRIKIENGRLSIIGNATSPSVGIQHVERIVTPVAKDATEALAEATRAHEAADQAESDAARAHTAATEAWQHAEEAADAASTAQHHADVANEAATNAQNSAARANTHANDALNQLSVIEDVAGTLRWISDHGSYVLTTDTTVQEGTVYFELDGGDYVPVTEPTGSPVDQGWYVLDVADTQSDYIMAHLAVTAAGLWVLPSGMGQAQSAQYAPGYKLLLASTGAYLYDASGHLVTTYGESITFDSSRPQYIGGEDAYIVFYDSDDDGVPDSIRIGGSKVTIGGSSLSQVLADVAQASASAQQALDMCTIALTSTAGTVFKQDRGVSTTIMATVFTGDGLRITDAQALKGRFGAGAYLQWKWKDSGTDGFVTLLAADPRISAGGFTLTVSPEDISTQAVIDCELVY